MSIPQQTTLALPNRAACVSTGELMDARARLVSLYNEGQPIPLHMQEWLKQSAESILTELLALRQITRAAREAPTILPFPQPKTHAQEIANARAAERAHRKDGA